jgi:signal transduction histidine kinase
MTLAFWFYAAAYLTWAVTGLALVFPLLDGTLPPQRAIVGIAAFFGFVIAFASCTREQHGRTRSRASLAGLTAQAIAAVALVWATRNSLPGALLVVTAAGLPHVLGPRVVGFWVLAQTLALGAILWPIAGPVGAIASAGAFGGFQLFALAAASLALSESRAVQALASTNAELTATRELLAENSRVAERLRISRDLHDTLGHHLTALSIQLEVASRLSDGPASNHIREAHAIAKLLLADVRSVVSTLRGSSRIDLSQALRALALVPGRLSIHLDMPEQLALDDAAQAHALLRCVQEIITNAARHAAAQNLWITIAQRPDGIDLQARDDGRGSTELQWGNGLRGMRERFEEYAGRIEVHSTPGHGFEVRGFMPRPEAA